MKKNPTLFLALLISFLSYGQCPDNPNITITSQAEIDSFATDYPGCTSLSSLIIEGPDITNLNGLSQIEMLFEFLVIQETSIQDFNGLDNLSEVSFELVIRDNPSLLDFTGLGSLERFGFATVSSNENLESFSGIGAISQVIFDQEGFNIINNDNLQTLEHLSGMTANVFMRIDSNDLLTDLNGLQNMSFMTGINISNNDLLTDITALQNVPIPSQEFIFIIISGNELLSNCSITNFCNLFIQNTDNQSIVVQNNLEGCNTVEEVIDNCESGFNQISGMMAYDLLGDGCDDSDDPVSSVLIQTTDGIDSIHTTTNDDGTYTIFVGEGTYTTSVVLDNFPTYYDVMPNDVETTFTTVGNTEEIDFCMGEGSPANDLNVVLIPLGVVRPGFDTDFQLIVTNMGTQPASGSVSVTIDDTQITYVSSIPTENDNTGNTISWNFTDISPLQSDMIQITMNSFPPPTNDIGDEILFLSEVTPVAGDETPEDNTSILEMIYVNSQDPNDKLVAQGESITQEEVGSYIDYVVRFQNIGTGDAINVRVDDLLDDHLDWDTFRVLSASHDYRVEITGGNNVSFIFDDINLPSVDDDQEGSNGYVSFQLRSNTDLVVGDVISNRANIFFDFNAPIITNTVMTEVVDNLSIEENALSGQLSLYPNPTSDHIIITTTPDIGIVKTSIYSMLGEKVLLSTDSTIDISSLRTGIYFFEIVTTQGSITKRVIKK